MKEMIKEIRKRILDRNKTKDEIEYEICLYEDFLQFIQEDKTVKEIFDRKFGITSKKE